MFTLTTNPTAPSSVKVLTREPGIVGTSIANGSRSTLNNAFAGGSVGDPGTSTTSFNGSGRNSLDGLEVNPFDWGGKVTNSYGVAGTWRLMTGLTSVRLVHSTTFAILVVV